MSSLELLSGAISGTGTWTTTTTAGRMVSYSTATSTSSSTLSVQLNFNSQPSLTVLQNAVYNYSNQTNNIKLLIPSTVSLQPIDATSIIQTITISSNKNYNLKDF